jgi:hypothetical protein
MPGQVKGDKAMPIDPKAKKQWEKLQEKYNYPVDALGRPVDPKDQKTLTVWREEGIDRFQKK